MIVLPKTQILSPLFCFSKKRLFEEIAECAAFITKKTSKEIIVALNEREKLGTTVFFQGVAIPHAVIQSSTPTFAVNAMRLSKNEKHKVETILNQIDLLLDHVQEGLVDSSEIDNPHFQ